MKESREGSGRMMKESRDGRFRGGMMKESRDERFREDYEGSREG